MLVAFCVVCVALCGGAAVCRAQDTPMSYQGRRIAGVEILVEGARPGSSTERELLRLVPLAAGEVYTAALARDSLLALYGSRRIADARVEVTESTLR